MPRVKRGTTSIKTRKKILKYTKGFKWGRKSKERAAKEALLHAWSFQFADRKKKKRNFRRLWQIQINAGVRQYNLSYSKFIAGLKKNNIEIDRKILSGLAQNEPEIFKKIVDMASTPLEKSRPKVAEATPSVKEKFLVGDSSPPIESPAGRSLTESK